MYYLLCLLFRQVEVHCQHISPMLLKVWRSYIRLIGMVMDQFQSQVEEAKQWRSELRQVVQRFKVFVGK